MQIFSKKLTSVLLATAMLGTLGACGTATSEGEPQQPVQATAEATPTPEMKMEELMKGFKEKAEAVEGESYQLGIDSDMAITLFGQTVSAKTLGVDTIESDGVNSYVKESTTTTIEGEEPITEEAEAYYMKEGDSITKYAVKDGKWTKLVKNYPTYGMNFVKLASVDLTNATLEETDDEYIITVAIPYDELGESLPSETQDQITESSGVQEDALKISDVPVVYHFDKANGDIKTILIDLAVPFNEAFQAAMESAKGDTATAETAEPKAEAEATAEAEAPAEEKAEVATDSSAETSDSTATSEEFDYSTIFSMVINTLKIEVSNITFSDYTVSLPEEATNAVEVLEEVTSTENIDLSSLQNTVNATTADATAPAAN